MAALQRTALTNPDRLPRRIHPEKVTVPAPSSRTAVDPIFVTGGTGYIGRPLIEALHERGHAVHALVRRGSEARLPAYARQVIGDALDAASFASAVPAGATVVHLVGTPHPQSGESRPVPERRPRIDSGDHNGRAAGRRATPCVCQRGAPGAGDAGLHRGPNGRRGAGQGDRASGNDPATSGGQATDGPIS